jgi:hypothetical protein
MFPRINSTNRNQKPVTSNQKFILILLFIFSFLIPNSSAQDKITYDDKGKRDPFISLVTPDGRIINFEPQGAESKIILGGIIYDPAGNSYAIINNEVVGVNDFILGHVVAKIEPNRVILLENNQAVEYKLNKDETYGTK